MMISGVELSHATAGARAVIALPLMVIPFFNFGPRMQLNLVHTPRSRWIAMVLFAASLLLTMLWLEGLVGGAFVAAYSSLWSQVLFLRVLTRRYFKLSGIYPGQVSFWAYGAENNTRLSRRNRMYALLLLIVGTVQLILLAAIV